MSTPLPLGVERLEHVASYGKHYVVPVFDTVDPVVLRASPYTGNIPRNEPVVVDIGSVWDLDRFRTARAPVSFGMLSSEERALFSQPGAQRVLDLPVKIPDVDEVRLPRALRQFAPTIQRLITIEAAINPHAREWFAYLAVDHGDVEPGTMQREAPVHSDGFLGARFQSLQLRINHSFIVSDALPTAFFVQPFDFSGLDLNVHNFFIEMSAQVADTDERHRLQHAPGEVVLMDCYCAHRGVENTGTHAVRRTWLRLSFEERRRVYDRLGNTPNPLFDLRWPMVERDVKQLGLVPFRS
jgi:hypothetical protein